MKTLLPFLAVILVLGAMASAFRMTSRLLPLQVAPDATNMGTVWAQKEFRWSFDVSNPNTKAIKVTQFMTSCNCTATEPASITIPPQQSAEITLVLDVRSTSDGSTEGVGNFSVSVAPVMADAGMQTPWIFSAAIREAISISRHEDRLLLPVAVGSENPIFELDVEVIASAKSTFTNIVAEPLDGFVETTLSGPDPYRVSAVLSRDASVGFFETGIKLFGITPNGTPVFLEQVLVSGYAAQNVSANPRIVDFGVIAVDTLHQKDIVLASQRGSFRVLASRFDSAESIRELDALMSGADSCSYRLDVLPTTEGHGREVVTFVVQDEHSEQEYEVTVPVCWFAVRETSRFAQFLGDK